MNVIAPATPADGVYDHEEAFGRRRRRRRVADWGVDDVFGGGDRLSGREARRAAQEAEFHAPARDIRSRQPARVAARAADAGLRDAELWDDFERAEARGADRRGALARGETAADRATSASAGEAPPEPRRGQPRADAERHAAPVRAPRPGVEARRGSTEDFFAVVPAEPEPVEFVDESPAPREVVVTASLGTEPVDPDVPRSGRTRRPRQVENWLEEPRPAPLPAPAEPPLAYDEHAPAEVRIGSDVPGAIPGRRTVVVRGRPDHAATPRRPERIVSPQRGGRSFDARLAGSPDRIAAWAVGMGIVLVMVAVSTANAAPV